MKAFNGIETYIDVNGIFPFYNSCFQKPDMFLHSEFLSSCKPELIPKAHAGTVVSRWVTIPPILSKGNRGEALLCMRVAFFTWNCYLFRCVFPHIGKKICPCRVQGN